jgi:hypothetical protein
MAFADGKLQAFGEVYPGLRIVAEWPSESPQCLF